MKLTRIHLVQRTMHIDKETVITKDKEISSVVQSKVHVLGIEGDKSLRQCSTSRGNLVSKEEKMCQTDETLLRTNTKEVETQTFITGLQRLKTQEQLAYLRNVKRGGVVFNKVKKD